MTPPSTRASLLWFVIAAAMVGCAPVVQVRPVLPPSIQSDSASGLRAALYVDPGVRNLRLRATTPSGDIGIGEITVEFDLGPALALSIARSAQNAFRVLEVVTNHTCAEDTEVLLEASLAASPYIQVDWRDETPRVGGGTVAEITVRIVQTTCAGQEIGRAIAKGYGRAENMQTLGNWPNEDDFRPGIDAALANLQSNLAGLFADMAAKSGKP